jgi:outer membrane protein OmpA-like peptidoglycan-associated protein
MKWSRHIVFGVLYVCSIFTFGSKVFSQENLLLNGSLKEYYGLDSNELRFNLAIENRIGIKINHWEQNVCQQFFSSTYSHANEPFLTLTYYKAVGEHDAAIHNLIGQLCRPLIQDSTYKISLYIKLYSGNAVSNSFSIGFFSEQVETKFYIDNFYHKKKAEQMLYKNPDFTYKGWMNDIDSFYFLSFDYKAKGGEKYICLGNFTAGRPDVWKRTKPYGYFKGAFKYDDWLIYAVSDLSVYPMGMDLGCSSVTTNNDEQVMNHIPTLVVDDFKTDTIYVLHQIFFRVNSASLLEVSQEQIDELVIFLRHHPNLNLTIIGHTDSTGSSAYNLSLSQSRADAVKQQLVQLGIASERIVSKGFGSEQPIADNSTESGRSLNRRVEVVFRAGE